MNTNRKIIVELHTDSKTICISDESEMLKEYLPTILTNPTHQSSFQSEKHSFRSAPYPHFFDQTAAFLPLVAKFDLSNGSFKIADLTESKIANNYSYYENRSLLVNKLLDIFKDSDKIVQGLFGESESEYKIFFANIKVCAGLPVSLMTYKNPRFNDEKQSTFVYKTAGLIQRQPGVLMVNCQTEAQFSEVDACFEIINEAKKEDFFDEAVYRLSKIGVILSGIDLSPSVTSFEKPTIFVI